LKAGFLSPADILSSDVRLLQRVAEKVSDELNTTFGADDVLSVFTNLFAALGKIESDVGLLALADGYRASRNLASSGYLRTELSSQLVGEAIQNVVLHPNTKHPMLSAVSLSKDARAQVEVLKQYTFLATIYSSRVKLPEFRGYEVVSGIFEALSGPRGNLLMPEDVRAQHEVLDGDLDGQMRLVCDFVAGMTDRYAMEFYGRLHSDSAQSMFKPI
jgi:dGTPase